MKHYIRILVYGLGSNLGGIENFIITYYRNINNNKIKFDFVCCSKKPVYYNEIINKGSNVYIIPSRRENYHLHCKQIKNIFTRNQYDVVWSNLNSLSDIMFLYFAHKHNIKKRIVHAHNSRIRPGEIITGILHNIYKRKIAKYCTDFWACSHEAGKFFFPDSIINTSKFKIIHNAINMNAFTFNKTNRTRKRKELNLDDELVIGHIGNFTYQKNHNFLLNVFHEIHKNIPDSLLLLVGDGKLYKRIKNQASILGLAENIIFLGKRTDIPELLHAMDIFIFPSHYEGLGIVLIEAQAAGLPCFVSDVIPQEVIITDTIYPISLNESASSWANKVISSLVPDKPRSFCNIQQSGYDIKSEAELLEHYFLENCG